MISDKSECNVENSREEFVMYSWWGVKLTENRILLFMNRESGIEIYTGILIS